jgi:hypothetical protein
MAKKMKLGLHTCTLHLWGLGQNRGIVADPRPKEMNLLQLMDMDACIRSIRYAREVLNIGK